MRGNRGGKQLFCGISFQDREKYFCALRGHYEKRIIFVSEIKSKSYYYED